MRKPTRYGIVGLALTAISPILASPPPPPPESIYEAGKVLVSPKGQDMAKVDALFADDVTVDENGKRIVTGKAAWRTWWSDGMTHYFGRTVLYSEGWAGGDYDHPIGSLLVVDRFDSMDTAHMPGGIIADPRITTRTILYQFGADQRVHSVLISKIDNTFWQDANALGK